MRRGYRRRRVGHRSGLALARYSTRFYSSDDKLSDEEVINYAHYRSLREYMNAKPSATNEHVHSNEGWMSMTGRTYISKKKWYGMEFDELLKCAKTGWKEGLRKIRKVLKALPFAGVTSIRRRKVWREFGDSVDMQRIYTGQIDRAWQTTERVQQRGVGKNVATLMVSTSALANVTQAQAFWRGALLVTLADALVASGRSVRIIGYNIERGAYKNHYGELSCRTFVIKESTAPLNMERLAFATACVGFHRIWGFRSKAVAKDELTSGLGSSVYLNPGSVEASDLPKPLQKHMGNAGTWIIDNVWSQSAAEECMAKVATQLNSTVQGGMPA